MNHSKIQIRPYSSAIGAEIFGIDLSIPLDARTWSEIHQAFHDHLVIFFRDQHISPSEQLAFARRFGELEPYPFVHGIDGYPDLIEIVKMPNEIRSFGSPWHVDMSFRQAPPLGAVLYALEMPSAGGDTLFCNTYLAYETLSEGMKEMVGRLRAEHNSGDPKAHSNNYRGMSLQEKKGVAREIQSHPLVRTHPVTGKKSLFISPSYSQQLEDMTLEESRVILDQLEEHATQHEYICRFRWAPHSIAVWDNRCAMHRVLDDDLAARAGGEGFKRVMRRATIRI